MAQSLARTVQIALLGEVPPTLRFLYVDPESENLSFHAVFTDEATNEHIESAQIVFTEIEASLPFKIVGSVKIERDSNQPWDNGNKEHLMYLRWGELNAT